MVDCVSVDISRVTNVHVTFLGLKTCFTHVMVHDLHNLVYCN